MAQAAVDVRPASARIPRWSTERPLRILVILAAAAVWIALAVSLIGIAYALLLAVVFFVAHLAFITHLRGSGVRLGPEQMPELHQRVVALAERIGLRPAPDAYLVQAGGALNALATKFLRSNFIVLYSDLLEACGENDDARDFIIAHELGHLHAGHLRWHWLLLPGLAVPFLGTAYSRAREYTCDRYGIGASESPQRAIEGLCILAAGGEHAPRVNRRALAAQQSDLETIWMKIGSWLATHPPIASRLVALEPSLGEGLARGRMAALGALIVLALAVAVPVGIFAGSLKYVWPRIQAAVEQQQQRQLAANDPTAAIQADVISLIEAAESYKARAGLPPADLDELYGAWVALHPQQAPPVDPYHGTRYGYRVEGVDYVIYSAGADPNDPRDDIGYSSAAAASD